MKLVALFALAAMAHLKLVKANNMPFCTSQYYSNSVCAKFDFPTGADCNENGGGPQDVDEKNPAKFSTQRAYEFAVGITNVFENSQAQVDYATCEPIGDGRGYTCGSGGYTSDDGSMQDPLQRYSKLLKEKNLKNPFAKYMSAINNIADNSGCSPYRGSVKGLNGIGKLWTRTACTDKLFRQAQDEAVAAGIDHWAMSHAAFYNVKTNLGLAIFRDTMEMHGDGGGEPHIGLEKIGRLTLSALGGKNVDEKVFIPKFLEIRRQMLCCYRPKDSHGKADTTWPEAADRIADLQRLVTSNNWDLDPPIKLVNYEATLNKNFNLYATPKECKHVKSRGLDPSTTTTVNDTLTNGGGNIVIPAAANASASTNSSGSTLAPASVSSHAGRNRLDVAGVILSLLAAIACLVII